MHRESDPAGPGQGYAPQRRPTEERDRRTSKKARCRNCDPWRFCNREHGHPNGDRPQPPGQFAHPFFRRRGIQLAGYLADAGGGPCPNPTICECRIHRQEEKGPWQEWRDARTARAVDEDRPKQPTMRQQGEARNGKDHHHKLQERGNDTGTKEPQRRSQFPHPDRTFQFDCSINATRPFRSISGDGGQPAIWRSTGTTCDTPPTTA